MDVEWQRARLRRRGFWGNAGAGMLRVTLLFGSLGVALALTLAPVAEKRTRVAVADAGLSLGIDRTTTASVRRDRRSYTIRHSVLQEMPEVVCVAGRC